MLNYSSHLSVAKNLLSGYKPGLPLNIYLKSHFRQHKKYGSRDRKLISGLCYNYFRLGAALKNISLEERILWGYFLCENKPSEFLQSLNSGWNKAVTKPVREKFEIGNWQRPWREEIENIFPYKSELSNTIDSEKFSLSFFNQPKLYLRIRPGFNKMVLQKLQVNNIHYEAIKEDCIAFANSAKIDTVIDLDREAVVQDYNSQRVGELLKLAIAPDSHWEQSPISTWDCCAASGGKAIMAYDLNSSIKLTVSDKRESILKNLNDRFATAGIKNYQSFVANLSGDQVAMRDTQSYLNDNDNDIKTYDLIIADVPCTGSGTWARTPEQLYFFDQKQIQKYSGLQKQIVENVLPYLKPGGYLLYITCSVFKKENEEAADFIKEKLLMKPVKIQLLEGYEMQADTMFAALFKRPPITAAT